LGLCPPFSSCGLFLRLCPSHSNWLYWLPTRTEPQTRIHVNIFLELPVDFLIIQILYQCREFVTTDCGQILTNYMLSRLRLLYSICGKVFFRWMRRFELLLIIKWAKYIFYILRIQYRKKYWYKKNYITCILPDVIT